MTESKEKKIPTTSEIFDAIKDGDIQRIDEFLSKHPSLISLKSDSGETLFLLSIYYRRQEIKELLLSKGYEPDHFESAASGNLSRLKVLIEENEERLNSFSEDGFTPLGLAAYFGHVDAATFLIKKGAKVNTASNNNFRVMPLHSAVANKNLEITKSLLEHGADVNAKQQQDFTAIHQAAFLGETEIVRLLLQYNADKNLRTRSGLTPLDLAKEKGHTSVLDLLARD